LEDLKGQIKSVEEAKNLMFMLARSLFEPTCYYLKFLLSF